MTTVIVIPVLNRPHHVADLIENIEAVTPEPHSVLFVADPHDTAELGALAAAHATWIAPGGHYAQKINEAYRRTTAPFIFQAADDLVFHRYWLDVALEHMDDPKIGVVGTVDMGNPATMIGQHSTHSLIRRAYIETDSGVVDMPGTVMFPGYGHEYCDTEFVGTAKARGAYVHAFGSVVEHQHPAWRDDIPDDATYRKGQSTGPTDRRLYERRRPLWEPVPEPRLVHRAPRRMPVR
jgi:hypothetical protein